MVRLKKEKEKVFEQRGGMLFARRQRQRGEVKENL
jgi:hypothetical protein